LVMPGMNGYEVINRLKANPAFKDIPIILLTASKYIRSESESRGDLTIRQQGGLKPMEVLKLLNTITQTVNH
jgi:CheY-like chemotaxis protein